MFCNSKALLLSDKQIGIDIISQNTAWWLKKATLSFKQSDSPIKNKSFKQLDSWENNVWYW